ncbi:MAG: SGNH/GDSL hydrolase family protein [Oligoflexia bacterium]|nr:SGNH/GDSL hydrolase family protein [Oligoflexia bacterium]
MDASLTKDSLTETNGSSGIGNTAHKALGFGVLVAIGSLFFTLVVLELVFRLVAPASKQILSWSDRPKRYYFVHASHDVRDFQYSRHKTASTFRIVVLGDSFSFGDYLQFDDTFPKRLERYLNLNEGVGRVEVINYGVSSYSTVKESKLLRQAMHLEPDLILLQITLNDPEIVPFHPRHPFQGPDGKVHLPKILNYWKSLKFIIERVAYHRLEREYREYFHNLFSEPRTRDYFVKGITAFQHVTAAHFVPLGAVLFPLFDSTFDEKYEFAHEHQQVDTLLAERNIPHLDLLPFYEHIPAERLQVIPHENAHPNEIAHRIASEAIYSWLQDAHLVPEYAFSRAYDSVRIGLKPPALPG